MTGDADRAAAETTDGAIGSVALAWLPAGDYEQAVTLWDAIELIATTSGMNELKRSNRILPDFA